MLVSMSTIGQVGDGNLLVSSMALSPVSAVQPQLQTEFARFEDDNASILAASLGLGVHIDTWA